MILALYLHIKPNRKTHRKRSFSIPHNYLDFRWRVLKCVVWNWVPLDSKAQHNMVWCGIAEELHPPQLLEFKTFFHVFFCFVFLIFCWTKAQFVEPLIATVFWRYFPLILLETIQVLKCTGVVHVSLNNVSIEIEVAFFQLLTSKNIFKWFEIFYKPENVDS